MHAWCMYTTLWRIQPIILPTSLCKFWSMHMPVFFFFCKKNCFPIIGRQWTARAHVPPIHVNQSWPEPDSSTLALAHLLPSNTRQPRELKIPHTTKACYPLQKDNRIFHVNQTRIQPWKAVLHTYPTAQSGPDNIHKASWQIRFNSQLTLSTMQNRWNGRGPTGGGRR